MPVPDILGLRLTQALQILADAGWEAVVKMTYPPRRENISATGPRRVLRVVRTGDGLVELTAAYEGAGEGCSGDRPRREP